MGSIYIATLLAIHDDYREIEEIDLDTIRLRHTIND